MDISDEATRELEIRNPLLAQARAKAIDPLGVRDRRKTGKSGSWSITEPQQLHQEIKRRIFLGQKGVKIAEELGCSPSVVSSVKNSPIIKDELAKMNAVADVNVIDIEKRVSDLAPVALELVKDCLIKGNVKGESLSAKTILAEANKILDRGIGKPTQNINSVDTHLHFTVDDLKQIKAEAIAMKHAKVISVNNERSLNE